MQRAADEQRLDHHLVPTVFGKLLDGIGVVMCDRLKYGFHVGAHTLAGALDITWLLRIKRQAAIKGDQLANIRRREKLLKTFGETRRRYRRRREEDNTRAA